MFLSDCGLRSRELADPTRTHRKFLIHPTYRSQRLVPAGSAATPSKTPWALAEWRRRLRTATNPMLARAREILAVRYILYVRR
jgi:hypothetical protein